MRGAVLYGPRDVRFEERETPKIVKPTDAIIRISATCVCGSDLWPYQHHLFFFVPAFSPHLTICRRSRSVLWGQRCGPPMTDLRALRFLRVSTSD